jgi:hypothetical protein
VPLAENDGAGRTLLRSRSVERRSGGAADGEQAPERVASLMKEQGGAVFAFAFACEAPGARYRMPLGGGARSTTVRSSFGEFDPCARRGDE